MGPALARRRALRRHARLRQGQAARPRLALSRLRHRRLQRRPAFRPVHPRASRRRRARSPAIARGAIATGFIAAGPWDFVGHVELREGTVDKLKTRLLDRDDMVSSTMSTFVSLTVHCARCHDHKFDPITQTDYYRLQAVFAGVDRGDRPYQSPELAQRRRSRWNSDASRLPTRSMALERRIAALTSPAVATLDEQIKALRRAASGTARTRSQPRAARPTDTTRRSILSPTPPLGPGRPRRHASRSTRSACPGPADRLSRHARLWLPGSISRRGLRRSDLRSGRTRRRRRASDHRIVEDEPYVIRPRGRSARYVRVTATRLWKRLDDYVFALAELEVISGGVNRARGQGDVRSTRSRPASGPAPTWSTASTAATPARPADAGRRTAPRPALPDRQVEQERQRLAEALIDPSLRSRARGDVRRAGGDRPADPGAAARRRWSTGPVASAPPDHRPAPRGSRAARRAGRPGHAGVPARSSGHVFAAPTPTTRGAAAPPWPTGSPARANMLTWRSIANRLWHYHFRPRASSRRPTTSAATAPGRRIPSCSTGWPSSCATAVSRSRPCTG